MAGGINNIEMVSPPLTGDRRRGDCNPSFALLYHPVHNGSAVMHLTHSVNNAAVEENSLRGGCLTGIDMSHYSKIPERLEAADFFFRFRHRNHLYRAVTSSTYIAHAPLSFSNQQ